MIRLLRVKEVVAAKAIGSEVIVAGWVRSMRDAKELSFIELNDGSMMGNLQIVVDKNNFSYNDTLREVSTGASIKVKGKVTASVGSGQEIEILASFISVLGSAPNDYPLQKKRHSLEFLREISHLRSRTNTIGAVMRVRNVVSFAIHQFFQERDFVYIHTPIITSSDAEGAGDMFQVTTIDMDKKGAGEVDYSRDFFGCKTHLTVSGQLAVESYCIGLGQVYTFGPTFRAENSNTVRHAAEFWMIEPEMAFYQLDELMAISQDFLRYLINAVLEKCPQELEFFNERIKPGLIENLRTVATSNFSHMTYTQAIDVLKNAIANHGKVFEHPVEWGIDLKSEHERYLTEEHIRGPVMVTDYPKEIKSFYMKLNDDGKTVRGMDILVPGIGEIIGGSEREDNYDLLKERMIAVGLDVEEYGWYLDLRKYGSVPHSGFGLGLERFVMWVTGMSNIRDVIPFPRTVKHCQF
ncbi:asparagine--tRNA ligase [Entomospira culicis]|uniref:Asparagine--tRNA ligase n=1 Tax=Entomospira culicis TaxID=2719989 RepID=A0A968GI48_9SPIO|nr:asparagine--tRNA ligase [Entomospira culicis]NIZ19190.1 asparagine--tRNA ligase [Entomospira culicis]NIZ69404.1 asparagine--tRNA ligase [Entomospira culicis]WDI36521.1 asparagine--tRNA ligase [Entomospira culicis]WDI38147.1 asparagine--tRNA ligase [Entomospira culicis]